MAFKPSCPALVQQSFLVFEALLAVFDHCGNRNRRMIKNLLGVFNTQGRLWVGAWL
jgi:hypothetical protein